MDRLLRNPDDGFAFGAYHVAPADARRGGLVLIHEIFGVTPDIRGLCDAFAEDGYEVLAPSLFDRLEPGFQAGDDGAGFDAGRRLSRASPWDQVRGDLQAAIEALEPPVNIVGYCWGGAAAWLAACRCDGVAAVSSYYGRRIVELLDENPRCPTILHFGKADTLIPPDFIDQIAAAHPDLPIYLYDAGHGFASDRALHADSARLARLRTLQLFQQNSAGRAEQ